MSVDPQTVPQPVPVPLPPQPAPVPGTDPISGAVLQQMGQGVTPSPTPVQVTSGPGKEGAPIGLPESTEIPISQAQAIETATPVSGPESGPTAGAVEVEQGKELEPEVQEVQRKIAEHKLNAPTETVVAAPTMPAAPPQTVAQPVVVLPLSEKDMEAGKSKDPSNSVRWLYTWCVRQIRKFADTLVVYRDE